MDPVTHGLVGAAAGLSILTAWQRKGLTASQRKGWLEAGANRDAYKTRWAAALCGLIGGELQRGEDQPVDETMP